MEPEQGCTVGAKTRGFVKSEPWIGFETVPFDVKRMAAARQTEMDVGGSGGRAVMDGRGVGLAIGRSG